MPSNRPAQSPRTRTDEQLIITRVFDAPSDDVFDAWIEHERAKRWWGPKGFDTPILDMDLRRGGEWHATMVSPQGNAYPQRGVFREIRRPHQLAFTWKWVNKADPESLITVELVERDGKTEMTFRQSFFASSEARKRHEERWNESFDRLATELTKTTSAPKSPAQAPTPGPQHRRLDVFVGRWKGTGESQPDSPLPGKMTVVDAYQWLPGGFFLVNRGELRVGDNEATHHLWLFGYDAARGIYVIRAFDGQGFFREYLANVRDRVWTFTGERERARLEFTPDGNRFTAHWDISKDGSTWSPLCDVSATKVP